MGSVSARNGLTLGTPPHAGLGGWSWVPLSYNYLCNYLSEYLAFSGTRSLAPHGSYQQLHLPRVKS